MVSIRRGLGICGGAGVVTASSNKQSARCDSISIGSARSVVGRHIWRSLRTVSEIRNILAEMLSTASRHGATGPKAILVLLATGNDGKTNQRYSPNGRANQIQQHKPITRGKD
jgi:hypothetical protein